MQLADVLTIKNCVAVLLSSSPMKKGCSVYQPVDLQSHGSDVLHNYGYMGFDDVNDMMWPHTSFPLVNP